MYLSPIILLYRHSFELCLKQIISEGIRYELLESNEKVEEKLGEHSLYPLWNLARIVIERAWPDEDKQVLTNVERVIQQFHNVDSTGQVFRYAKTKHDDATLKHNVTMDYQKLKETCSNVFSFLHSCFNAMDWDF